MPKIYFDISDSSLQGNTKAISDLVNRILKDNPDLNTFDSYTVGYNYINFEYLYSSEKILEMRKQVNDKADEIIANIITPNMSSLKKRKSNS